MVGSTFCSRRDFRTVGSFVITVQDSFNAASNKKDRNCCSFDLTFGNDHLDD
jgi:hypothetical protein